MKEARLKYAVAILNGDRERIMATFDTKAEADAYGFKNKVPSDYGLQFCYSSLFLDGEPTGDNMSIYTYYNR